MRVTHLTNQHPRGYDELSFFSFQKGISTAMTGFVFGMMMMCGMMCEMYTMCMCMPENKDGRVISSLI